MTPRRGIALIALAATLLIPAPRALANEVAPIMTLIGPRSDEAFGAAVAAAGDVNHDGFGDLIVGARSRNLGGSKGGSAYLYFGGPVPDLVPDVILSPGPASFGAAVSGAGDVNGDGYDDWIVGAPEGDGRAYLFLGGAVPDNVPDLILSGSPGEAFGTAVAGAGDVNQDGFDDVIVGGPHYSDGSPTGRAVVFLGGALLDGFVDWTLRGEPDSDFGAAVAGAGDLNRDGYPDVVVGAPSDAGGGPRAGAVRFYYGGLVLDALADLTVEGDAPGDALGSSVATAGDPNRDGAADALAAAPGSDENGTDAGASFVYFGADDAVADLEVAGEFPDDALALVAGPGDVNGDGFDDLAVSGAYHTEGGVEVGRVYVYTQTPPSDSTPVLTLTGTPAIVLGASLAGAGDVNGDHRPEVAAGATRTSDGFGRVYVFANPGVTTATHASLISIEATGGRVSVRWRAAANGSARIERRTPATDWRELAGGVADGAGQIVYEDPEVEVGARYGYRLKFADGRSAGEAWVDVPREAVFALEGVRPHPSLNGELTVFFSVVSLERVRLEVLDVAGRRVIDREVTSPAPGRQTVRLAERHRLPAGLYLVRLSQGRVVRVARAVVLE